MLVFRDGDNINLYHVMERPDGSYSPLSDSWSGASIRNLFAEQDDPEVEQRIRENANTMSKMHEIKTQMERAGMRRQHTLPQESPRRTVATPELAVRPNLPPIRRRKSLGKEEWSVEPSKINRQKLPKVKVDKQRTIDFSAPSPTPSLSSLRNSSIINNNFLPSSMERPLSQRRRPSKLISLDVSELKKTVDDNAGFAPTRRTAQRSTRARTSVQGSRLTARPRGNDNEGSDIFTSPRAPALSSLGNDNEQNNIFHRPAPRSPAGGLPAFLTSSPKPRAHSGRNSQQKQDYLFNLNLSESLSANLPPSPRHSASMRGPSILEPDQEEGASRGMERRLLHSRRGRLGRREGGGSPNRVPTVLASPKGHSRERTSPRSPRTSPRLMRPSFPTRPLSGPKKKKTPHPRCAESECRKKINITNSYSCRCEMAFCAKHRHPEAHACTHDYKTEGRKLLRALNPMVTVPKLPKI